MATGLIVLGLVVGGGLLVWQASAVATIAQREDPAQRQLEGAVPKRPAEPRPSTGYQLTGSVRVEGTGEPVEGATCVVRLGDSGSRDARDQIRNLRSDSDGRFVVDLPPGQARSWTFFPPVGYWSPNNQTSQETFVLSKVQPIHRKDYLVRRGVVWTVRLTIGPGGRPIPGGAVGASTAGEIFEVETDDQGLARLTLPPDAGKLTIRATPQRFSFDRLRLIALEWDSGFSPDAVATLERRDGGFHMTDDAGKRATMAESDGVEPVVNDRKLVIQVRLAEPDSRALGVATGRVIDQEERIFTGGPKNPAV